MIAELGTGVNVTIGPREPNDFKPQAHARPGYRNCVVLVLEVLEVNALGFVLFFNPMGLLHV